MGKEMRSTDAGTEKRAAHGAWMWHDAVHAYSTLPIIIQQAKVQRSCAMGSYAEMHWMGRC